MLNPNTMHQRDFIESNLFGTFDEVNKLCFKSIEYCKVFDANTPPEKTEQLKAAKGDLDSLYETIEATLKSLRKMYVEYLFAMHEIFMIIKDNKNNSSSEMSDIDCDIDRMHKFIKKHSSQKDLIRDANHIFQSFKIWYDYAISTVNHCTNRLLIIVSQFKINSFIEQDIIKKEKEMMQIFG